MARLVLRDTTMTRAQVRNRVDKDVRSSHFERVVFADNCDFTGYDLRDCSFIECRLRGAILPTHTIDGVAATDYIYSWHTDWANAKLPTNLGALHREFWVEIFRQIAVNNPNPDTQALSDWFITNRDTWEGKAALQAAVTQTSLRIRPDRQWILTNLAPWPRVQAHVLHVAADFNAAVSHQLKTIRDRFTLDPEGEDDVVTRADLPTQDRFILSNTLTQRLSQRKGEPWRVQVHMLYPDIWVTRVPEMSLGAELRARWDWWQRWN